MLFRSALPSMQADKLQRQSRRQAHSVLVIAVILICVLQSERERRRAQFLEWASVTGKNAELSRKNAFHFEAIASREGSHPINKRLAERHRQWVVFYDAV